MQRIKSAASKPDQPFDWRHFRKEIIEEHKLATTEQDRVTLLGIYKIMMDSVDRLTNFSAEDRAAFRQARSREYKLLLIQEAKIGRTDGLLDPTAMKRI